MTPENDIICRHHDHTKGRSVRGVNLLNMVYHSDDITISIGFEDAYSELETKQAGRARLP